MIKLYWYQTAERVDAKVICMTAKGRMAGFLEPQEYTMIEKYDLRFEMFGSIDDLLEWMNQEMRV